MAISALWGHLEDSYFGLPNFFFFLNVFAFPRKSPKIGTLTNFNVKFGKEKPQMCVSCHVRTRKAAAIKWPIWSIDIRMHCVICSIYWYVRLECWFNVNQAHKWHCTSEFQMLVTWKDYSCMRSAVWIGQIACLRYTISQRFNILHYRMSPGCAVVASTSAREMHIL